MNYHGAAKSQLGDWLIGSVVVEDESLELPVPLVDRDMEVGVLDV